MSKKLAAKASLIQLPPTLPGNGLPASGAVPEGAGGSATPTGASPSASAPGPAASAFAAGSQAAGRTAVGPAAIPAGVLPTEARAKTAPGTMAHFMASQSAALKEAETLRERVKAFEGANPVLRIDATQVRSSRWANRHAASFSDAAFDELRSEIASAGGNVQPVSVRRLPASDATDGVAYELVFGHRRHRACLELGLPVLAMVVDVDDRSLFEAMERENRARKNLSAWEQGTMYRRALDEGLYPSQRKLAESLGVDVSLVSKSLSLARLPEGVVAAFASPLEIQFRWAQPLSEALQKDPDGVLARAAELGQIEPRLPSAQVLARLLGQTVATPLTASRRVIDAGNGRKATLSREADGAVLLRFGAGVLSANDERALARWVEQLLREP